LSWVDASDDETAFRVFRDSVEVASVPANSVSFEDTGLACGTQYSYVVYAINSAGNSPSNTASATTETCTTSCPPGDAAGTFAGATALALSVQRTEYICPVDDEDWYRFEVLTGQTMWVSLTGLPADYDVRLYRPDGSMVAQSVASNTTDEAIVYQGNVPGFWRVQIVGWNGASSAVQPYKLSVETFAPMDWLGVYYNNESLSWPPALVRND